MIFLPFDPGLLTKRSINYEAVDRSIPWKKFFYGHPPPHSGILKQADAFRESDLEALLNDLREFVAPVEVRLPEPPGDGGPEEEKPKIA